MPSNCYRTMYHLWLLCIWVVSTGNPKMSETMPRLQENSNPLRVRIVNYWPWLKTRWGKVLNKGRSKFLREKQKRKSDLKIRAEPNKEGHTEWPERRQTNARPQGCSHIPRAWTTNHRNLLCTTPHCSSPVTWVTFQNISLITLMPLLKTHQWFPIIVRISDQAKELREEWPLHVCGSPRQPSPGSLAQPQCSYFSHFSTTCSL